MDIICKIYCSGYRVAQGWGQFPRVRTVDFGFVANNSPENKKFWEATPSGQIQIGVANEGAMEHFDVGEEYYMVITKTKPEGIF